MNPILPNSYFARLILSYESINVKILCQISPTNPWTLCSYGLLNGILVPIFYAFIQYMNYSVVYFAFSKFFCLLYRLCAKQLVQMIYKPISSMY